jgi:hypothetical protein
MQDFLGDRAFDNLKDSTAMSWMDRLTSRYKPSSDLKKQMIEPFSISGVWVYFSSMQISFCLRSDDCGDRSGNPSENRS